MKIIPLYPTEALLIKGALALKPSAQKELYDRFAPKMLGICGRYVKDKATAEDVLIEGFLKVFEKLSSYSFQGSFEGWLRKIFTRTALDFLRKNKEIHFTALEPLERSLIEVPTHETEVYGSTLSLENLLAGVNELPEGYRLVFNLYVLDGYSHTEISKALEISVGTSKSQLSRARKMLQAHFKSLKTQRHGKN